MEDIRIYDFTFNLLHIEHDFISSNWTLKYNGIGTFEAHFPIKSGIVPVVMGNSYLVAVQGEKQAIVVGIQAGNDFAVFGRTVNWLLSKRTVAKFKTNDLSQSSLSEIIAYVLNESFIKNVNYPVDNMCMDCNVTYSIGTFWRNTRNTAYDVIHDLCARAKNSGHRLVFNVPKKQWVLELYQGNDLPLIISEGNRNASELSVSRDCLDFATDGWYERAMKDCGDWSPSENLPDVTAQHTDLVYNYYRVSEDGTVNGVAYKSGDYILCGADGYFTKVTEVHSVWERMGESTLSGIYRWEEKLTGSTPSEAADNLAKKKRNDDVTGQISRLSYGTDYQLGDTVRLQCKLGDYLVTYSKRISEVSFCYESNTESIRPIFGDDEEEIVQEV